MQFFVAYGLVNRHHVVFQRMMMMGVLVSHLKSIADFVSYAIVHKVAAYHNKSFAGEELFEGFSEQDIVSLTARVFEGAGFDTYLEVPYPEDIGGRCDLVANSWVGDEIWCEVKALVHNDQRLNKKRFKENEEIQKDFVKLTMLADGKFETAQPTVCIALICTITKDKQWELSPFKKLEDNLSEKNITSEFYYRPVIDLETVIDFDPENESAEGKAFARYLHVMVWVKWRN